MIMENDKKGVNMKVSKSKIENKSCKNINRQTVYEKNKFSQNMFR